MTERVTGSSASKQPTPRVEEPPAAAGEARSQFVRNRLRALIAAAGASSLGDGAWTAAVPLAAAAITRDPLAIGVVSAAGLLPWLVVSPFAGVLVDRWPHRSTLVVADLIRGLTVAVVALAVARGAVTIPVLIAGAFIVMTGTVFHGAAAQSVVADLTDHDPDLRNRTNGSVSAAETTGSSLVGPPAGSAAFVVVPWLPFLADALSFVASAALLTTLPGRTCHGQSGGSSAESLRSAIWAGMTWLARHRELRTLAILTGSANFTTNMVFALLVLYATADGGLAISPGGYGLLIAALALGGVIGAPVSARVLRRTSFGAAVLAAMLVRTLMWPVLALTSSAVTAGVALAVAGFASSIVTVSVTSARQQYTPRDMLGRVVTTFRTLGNGSAPLGALAGGLVASTWGLRGAFWAAAVLMAGALALAAKSAFRTPDLSVSQGGASLRETA